ncbi:MAG: sulfatase [Pseudomonadota bacterium]|nr:sulfatase [Pseudomonadota bacterium]
MLGLHPTRRDILAVLLVGGVAFGWAAASKSAGSLEGFSLPTWVPVFGDPLVDWVPDLVTQEEDLRQLRGEMARMPSIWEPKPGADIVVIVLDTVRADRMGLYGYDRATTPRIDAWAAGARVYDRMQSDGAWTLPSHASLFTGKPPIAHGAHGTPLGSDLAAPLADRSDTVARSLRGAGYRTAGVVANRAFLHRMWGLSQGFDMWVCEQLRYDTYRLPYTSGDRVTEMAKAVLARPREAPLFLFLNYMDAHAPWIPRRGYVRDADAIHKNLLPYHSGWESVTTRLLAQGTPAPEAQRAWSEAYDSELRFLDEQVGALLDALPGLGIDDDDYVFILSDHGEYLGEHALVEHSKDVYEEVLHVPLLVKGPGYRPGRDTQAIQTHDVASLILEAAGAGPLAGAQRTEDLQVSELYWSRHKDLKDARYGRRFDRIRRAFRQGSNKLIVGSDGSREAYDLSTDPRELTSELGSPWVTALGARADAWLDGQQRAPEARMAGPADLEALRALGYVE